MDFEKLPWFTAVETFCHGHGHEELENIDRQMLSNVIERTVIPKITGITHTHTFSCTIVAIVACGTSADLQTALSSAFSLCGAGLGPHVPPSVILSHRAVSQAEGGLFNL